MELQFSDEPLNIQQDFEEWEPAPEFAPPPQAGVYKVYVDNIREESEFQASVGKRYKATIDLRITGGEFDNRAVLYQRLNNAERNRGKNSTHKTSQLLDLVKAAGATQAPRSNADFSKVLHRLKDLGPAATFSVEFGWRGWCGPCYESELMKLTGKSTAEAAKAAASSDNDTRNKAADFATKAKSHRTFPLAPNGGRKESFLCPDCKQEIRAQVQIRRFLAPAF